MVTYIVDSKADLAKRDAIQSLVDAGELPALTVVTKRPSDVACWQGVYYAGQWYPPSDPRGAELIKMRYMLPAPKVSQPKMSDDEAWREWESVKALIGVAWLPIEKFVRCDSCQLPYGIKVLEIVGDQVVCPTCRLNRAMEPAAPKPNNSATVMLGSTEIEMGEGQYHRPGLAVRHSSQEKRLVVIFYASGRTGKQKNFWPLRVKRIGDQVEIDTQGASKSVVPLAEWQAFIDQVYVHVTDISRNTVELTPALITMARDVKAYRRTEPTDLEWAAENGAEVKPASEADMLKVWQEWMDAEVEANHNGFDTKYSGFILVGDLELVKKTGPRDFKNVVFRQSGIQLEESSEKHYPAKLRYSQVLANYVPEHRTIIHPPLADELIVAEQLNDFSDALRKIKAGATVVKNKNSLELKVLRKVEPAQLSAAMADLLVKFEHFVRCESDPGAEQAFRDAERHFRKLHNRAYRPPMPQKQRVIPGPADADRLMPRYRFSPVLANITPEQRERNLSWRSSRFEFTGDAACIFQLNALSEMLSRDVDALDRECAARWNKMLQAAKTAPISNETPKAPVIPPQALQSNSEAIEAIAMSKLPVLPEKIDELVEAVKVAVSEWSTNADARILPDGYYLRANPPTAPVPTYILLAHPDLPYKIVVGELSIMTDKDTHSELEFVSNRGEIREFMHKVAADLKPADNPKLAGVLMQAPIPEEAKAVSRVAGSNEFADVAKIEELPLFAPGEEPKGAA